MRILVGVLFFVAACGSVDTKPDAGCAVPQTLCGMACADLQSDTAHCGACDNACSAGETCSHGTCCATGQIACSGAARCIDPMTDLDHCGASADCMGANAGMTCQSPQTCNAGVCTACTPGMQQFSFTGAAESFTVPIGVSKLHVDVLGAQGGIGTGGLNPGAGGLGAEVVGDLTIAEGTTLTIFVGGQNGFNGGGAPGGGLPASGTGGGASDIRTGGASLADRLVVGGGGGGGAAGAQACGATCGGGVGGIAGTIAGAAGGPGTGFGTAQNSTGGGGGTQSAGGAGGVGGSNCSVPGGPGLVGAQGVGGAGGAAGSFGCSGTFQAGGGGGGGGGFFGGGGGAGGTSGGGGSWGGAGGGGGASFAGTLASTTLTAGVHSGDGSVTISWTCN